MRLADNQINITRLKPPSRDDLLRYFANDSHYGNWSNNPKCDSPLDALALRTACAHHALSGQWNSIPDASNNEPNQRYELCCDLLSATVVFIEPDMKELIGAMITKVTEGYASNLENMPQPKLWPFGSAFFVTPDGFLCEDGDLFHAMYMKPIDKGLVLIVFLSEETFKFCVVITQAERDAIALFLEEKVARIEERQPSHQLRKTSKKLLPQVEPVVRVLMLRELEGTENDIAPSDGSDKKKEYYSRWLVRGHVRNQWMPSRECHELKWIDPYIKGPEKAPFVEAVRHVKR